MNIEEIDGFQVIRLKNVEPEKARKHLEKWITGQTIHWDAENKDILIYVSDYQRWLEEFKV
jgi:hypothetical protein